MKTWNVEITAWVDEHRKVDMRYQYAIESEKAHTAAHRAMMTFDETELLSRYLHRVTVEVSEAIE